MSRPLIVLCILGFAALFCMLSGCSSSDGVKPPAKVRPAGRWRVRAARILPRTPPPGNGLEYVIVEGDLVTIESGANRRGFVRSRQAPGGLLRDLSQSGIEADLGLPLIQYENDVTDETVVFGYSYESPVSNDLVPSGMSWLLTLAINAEGDQLEGTGSLTMRDPNTGFENEFEVKYLLDRIDPDVGGVQEGDSGGVVDVERSEGR